MKILITILVLGGLLIATIVVMAKLWLAMGEVEISGHGLLALGLGVVLSLAVGIGLMVLVFFSSRRGHDDRAGH